MTSQPWLYNHPWWENPSKGTSWGEASHPCFSNRTGLQSLCGQAHSEVSQLSPCHWSHREICHSRKFMQGSPRFTIIQNRGQMLFRTNFCSLPNISGTFASGPFRQKECVWGGEQKKQWGLFYINSGSGLERGAWSIDFVNNPEQRLKNNSIVYCHS